MTTYGPGGPTASLRQITESDCALGCRNCIEGTICPLVALPAPIVCAVGRYIPNNASALSTCYECERYAASPHLLCQHRPPYCPTPQQLLPHSSQWQVPDRGWLYKVRFMRGGHLRNRQGQHRLQRVCRGRVLRGGWGKQRLGLRVLQPRHVVGRHRPRHSRGLPNVRGRQVPAHLSGSERGGLCPVPAWHVQCCDRRVDLRAVRSWELSTGRGRNCLRSVRSWCLLSRWRVR